MANLQGVVAHGRLMPHKTIDMSNVVCQSSRRGVQPHLIVLHDTESLNIPNSSLDLRNIGNFFDILSTQASAHVCDDADGNSARYVEDKLKAWSCVDFNSRSLNIEQIGRASQSSWPDAQLLETARWIALWHRRFDIPIQRATAANGWQGVARHSDLGVLGGGHSDPDGSPSSGRYPFDEVLRVARGFQHLWEAEHR